MSSVYEAEHRGYIYLDIIPLVIVTALAEQSMCDDMMDI